MRQLIHKLFPPNPKYLFWTYIVVVFLLVVLPVNSGDSSLNDNETLGIRWDYLIHAVVYLPLPVLLVTQVKKLWPTVLIALLIDFSFEFVQLPLPFRSFNVNDLLANSIGIVLGIILMLIFREKIMKLNAGTNRS